MHVKAQMSRCSLELAATPLTRPSISLNLPKLTALTASYQSLLTTTNQRKKGFTSTIKLSQIA